jgi:hypothetical protein
VRPRDAATRDNSGHGQRTRADQYLVQPHGGHKDRLFTQAKRTVCELLREFCPKICCYKVGYVGPKICCYKVGYVGLKGLSTAVAL